MMEKIMERYSIYTGKNLSKEKYLATWGLDNITFKVKDQISKKTALNWFEWSNRSTIVLWDNENNALVGYITPYLLSHKFSSDYIISGKTYHESLVQDVFIRDLGELLLLFLTSLTNLLKIYTHLKLHIYHYHICKYFRL